MRALGFEVKKVDVLTILKDYDREGTGKISFDDFKEVGKTTLMLETHCTVRGVKVIHIVNRKVQVWTFLFSSNSLEIRPHLLAVMFHINLLVSIVLK